jgi:hypothetical protein
MENEPVFIEIISSIKSCQYWWGQYMDDEVYKNQRNTGMNRFENFKRWIGRTKCWIRCKPKPLAIIQYGFYFRKYVEFKNFDYGPVFQVLDTMKSKVFVCVLVVERILGPNDPRAFKPIPLDLMMISLNTDFLENGWSIKKIESFLSRIGDWQIELV